MATGPTEPPTAESGRARDSWFHERESAWLYRRLAALETDPPKQRLIAALAAAAEDQAGT